MDSSVSASTRTWAVATPLLDTGMRRRRSKPEAPTAAAATSALVRRRDAAVSTGTPSTKTPISRTGRPVLWTATRRSITPGSPTVVNDSMTTRGGDSSRSMVCSARASPLRRTGSPRACANRSGRYRRRSNCSARWKSGSWVSPRLTSHPMKASPPGDDA